MPLKSFGLSFAAAIHPLIAFATIAAAAELVALKPEATVSTEFVRLGDVVTGAGDKAGVALFRSPDLGKFGTIRAESIVRAAAELGLHGLDLRGLSAITVSRPAREISAAELQRAIVQALAKLDGSLGDATLTLDHPPPALLLARDAEIAVEVPVFDMETGRFSAEIGQSGGRPVVMTGVVESRMAVAVLNRSIGRGDVIGPSDFTLEPRGRRSLPSGVVTDVTRLASVVARRPLRPGQILRADDLTGRDLVERNQKVTILYERPGISLSLTGKAMAAGPAGAVVPVQNVTSKRTFDAVVTGPGVVSARLNGNN